MTKQMKATLAAMLILSTMPGLAQTSTTAKPAKKATKKAPAESATDLQIRELREQMAAQQTEIDALKGQNASKDAKLSAAQQDAQTANASAAAATAQAQSVSNAVQENKDAVTKLDSTVTDLKNSNAGLAQTVIDTKKEVKDQLESPLTLHYKGVTILPVGFFAFEGVYRSRSINSDINTPFNSTPYPGAAQAHTSELNFSGRQSRLGGLFTGDAGKFKMAGYFEADFLGTGTTSNSNQSNSYVLRQRQIWGQGATQSGFAITGGQMWSLVTETKTSTDNRTENLPQTIDAQYHVGFSWARQPSLRLQQKVGMFTGAVSVEQAQIIYSASNPNANFFIGNAGTGGGLLNLTANYSNNVAPDVIVKITADPPHMGHYEIGGLSRWFRDRYYPNQTLATPSAAGGVNNTKVGGGFFANARFPVTKFADVGLHVLGGTGVGRYGTSSLPDVTVHPDGTLEPIKAYQGLFSLETHPTPKLDVFGYAGGEYAQRTVYLSTEGADIGKLVGYAPITGSNAGCNTETLPTAPSSGLGSIGTAGGAPYDPGTPANCAGVTRAVIAGTAGFIYRIYSSPKYGRLQYWGTYTYLTREAWNGITGGTYGTSTATFGSPKATNGMVFFSMRYYIP
jgi:uncharacterized small protein (DUF1192 family)